MFLPRKARQGLCSLHPTPLRNPSTNIVTHVQHPETGVWYWQTHVNPQGEAQVVWAGKVNRYRKGCTGSPGPAF